MNNKIKISGPVYIPLVQFQMEDHCPDKKIIVIRNIENTFKNFIQK